MRRPIRNGCRAILFATERRAPPMSSDTVVRLTFDLTDFVELSPSAEANAHRAIIRRPLVELPGALLETRRMVRDARHMPSS